MSELKYLFGPMRMPFLILTPACVALGVGTAVWTAGHVRALDVVIVLIGALAAHISVNALNEYFDFKSGLDYHTRRTPFSGGSGTLPQKPEFAGKALAIGLVSFGVTVVVGMYFLWLRGLWLLPLGLAGLVLIAVYTVWITRKAVLCLIAPGLGFGPLMVLGTNFALTGRYTWTALVASLVPFFLVSDLLLLNQFPDVEADRSVGRAHLPIVAGLRTSSIVYGAFLLLAYVTIVVGVASAHLPKASLAGLLTIVFALPAAIGAYRYATDIPKLVPYMAANVAVNILTPLLMAAGFFVSQ